MEANILRARARANLAGRWGLSIGVAAMAALFGALFVGSSFLPSINAEFSAYFPLLHELVQSLNEDIQLGNFRISIRSGILGTAAFILGGVVQLGYAKFLLKQHDGGKAEFNDLFSEFDRFGTGFAQMFLRNLYVTLWSLLLVIPGIVKSYSYAMTPFILAEHPDLSASQAIELSMQLMDGHKTDLFILDLTFFGWDLLAVLTLNIGYLWLNPYQNAARAAFYRQLLVENKYTSFT